MNIVFGVIDVIKDTDDDSPLREFVGEAPGNIIVFASDKTVWEEKGYASDNTPEEIYSEAESIGMYEEEDGVFTFAQDPGTCEEVITMLSVKGWDYDEAFGTFCMQ